MVVVRAEEETRTVEQMVRRRSGNSRDSMDANGGGGSELDELMRCKDGRMAEQSLVTRQLVQILSNGE